MMAWFWKVVGIFSLILLGLGCGAYIWKIGHTGRSMIKWSDTQKSRLEKRGIILTVGEDVVTKDEIAFELDLLADSASDHSEFDAIGEKKTAEKSWLKNEMGRPPQALTDSIAGSLMQRKLLFQMVVKDADFDSDEPKRLEPCLEKWFSIVNGATGFFADRFHQEFLKERLCQRSILKQYLEEKIYSHIQITEESVKAYYEANKALFQIPPQVLIRQIVTVTERQARNIRHKLTHANFAKMAKQHSITPEADNGGLLQKFAQGYGMPRFFDAALSLKKGQISDILKSEYGFHIILLENKFPSRQANYQEASEEVRKRLAKLERERAYQKWIDLALHTITVSKPRTAFISKPR